jgi:hypothetical protein
MERFMASAMSLVRMAPERDHDRHVRAADRQDHRHAEDQGAGQSDQQQQIQDPGVVVEGARTGEDQHDRAADGDDERAGRDEAAAGDDDGLAAQATHQLGRGHERAGEGHRPDQDVSDDERGQPAVERGQGAIRGALARMADEVVHRQQRRGPAAHGVEQRDQLRHGGHGHCAGQAQAGKAADCQPAQDDRPVHEARAAVGHPDHLGRDGRSHAGRGQVVAVAGRGR